MATTASNGSCNCPTKSCGTSATRTPVRRVTMRAGDICAMPADIRHQGYSTKRSMLLVWENATPNLPQRYESGELPPYPIAF